MRIFKRLLSLVGVMAALGICVMLYARYIEPKIIVTNELEMKHELIKTDTRVVLFADIHVGVGDIESRLMKLADKINEENGDIVIFLGDLFDDYSKYTGDEATVTAALTAIKGDKYAVYGNHDLGGRAAPIFRQIMKDSGFKLLVNGNILLPCGVNIIGADDMIFGKPSVQELVLADAFNLLAVHEPDFADSVSGVQLQTSGHTHGEQINIPFAEKYILPYGGKKYIHGEYEKTDGSKIYVNRGIGMSMIPYRFASYPEITCISLKAGK